MASTQEVADVEVPLQGLRGGVARAMEAGWRAPQVAIGIDVDMSACRERQRSTGLSPTPYIVRAAALALRAHPELNGSVSGGTVTRSAAVNVGLAVSVPGGLLVPVIRDADRKVAEEIAAEAAEAARRARTGALPTSAMQQGTFTVSTLGATGAAWFTPILNPPQIAILGVGALRDRPVVRGGDIVAAPTLTLTLVFDHRAVDGRPAGQCLATIRDLLEEGPR